MGRGWFIVRHVEDAVRSRTDQKFGRSGDVVDMDTIEDLAGLHQTSGLARSERRDRIAAGSIDAGKPLDGDRHALLQCDRHPEILGFDALPRAFGHRLRDGVLVHPRTIVVAVHTNGGQIADPLQTRCVLDGFGIKGDGRISGLARCDRHDEMRCRAQSAVYAVRRVLAVEEDRRDTAHLQRIELVLGACGSRNLCTGPRQAFAYRSTRIATAEDEHLDILGFGGRAVAFTHAAFHSLRTVSSLSRMACRARKVPNASVPNKHDKAQTAAPRRSGEGSCNNA